MLSFRPLRAISRVLLFALPLATSIALPGAAADESQLARLLQGFDETSLWHDGKTLVPTRKWTQPIQMHITGNSTGSLEQIVTQAVEKNAGLAGLTVKHVDAAAANFIVKFDDTSSYVINGRAAGCYATTRMNARGEIQRAELFVNFQMRGQLRQCIVHETMHAFGFPGHPHGLDSVLSYVHRREELTEIDEAAFRTLYDRRMNTNRYYLPSLQLARQVIAERLQLVPAGSDSSALARPYLDQAVRYLRDAAQAGQVMAQRQLGVAAYFAQVMAQDDVEAVSWWRKAAAQGDIDSNYWLGEAALAGRGMAKDSVAAFREHKFAAERGHALAMFRVGQALESGDGVPIDRPGAAAFFMLAATRGHQPASGARDALLAKLTPSDRTRADTLAREWKPAAR